MFYKKNQRILLLITCCVTIANHGMQQERKTLKQETILQSSTENKILDEKLMQSLKNSCPKQFAEMVAIIQDQKNLKTWYFPRQILLVGAPGTGKTSLGESIAQTTNLPIFFYDAAKLARDYSAFKGQNLLAVFTDAVELNKPCIVMIDGMECLNDNHVEMLAKLQIMLLNVKKDRIIFVGTAAHRTQLPASLQEHFKESCIEISLPNEAQRSNIITYFIQSRNEITFSSDISSQLLANKTNKFSPKNLQQLIQKAITIASARNSTTVTMQDCLRTIDAMRKDDKSLYEEPVSKKAQRWAPTIAKGAGASLAAYALYKQPTNSMRLAGLAYDGYLSMSKSYRDFLFLKKLLGHGSSSPSFTLHGK